MRILESGVTTGGIKITNLRRADGTTLIAPKEAERVSLLNRMERVCLELSLRINHGKTKHRVVDRTNTLQLTGVISLETVDDFIYLGANFSNRGSCEKEIRRCKRKVQIAKNMEY